jgi:hypothetical protein
MILNVLFELSLFVYFFNLPDYDYIIYNIIIQGVPLVTQPGWLADRCSVSQHYRHTHYRHIPLHFSHNERTPVQISLQYLHWC